MENLVRSTLVSAVVLAFLAVALGAFGAHALQDLLLNNNRLAVFETANQYHFYHALALFMLGLLIKQIEHYLFRYIVWAMVSGSVIFSASLYLLAITNVGWLGAITPIGGTLLLTAWGLLAYVIVNNNYDGRK